MRLPLTEADFESLQRYLKKKRFPVAGIRIQHSRYADDMNTKRARSFAYTQKGQTVIYCSAAMECLEPEVRIGILLHECGHIVANAFDEYAEISVDDFCVSLVPEARYHYHDVSYVGLSGRIRTAKAIEVVAHKFVLRLYR